MQEKRFHEVANLFPMMSTQELDKLSDDIKTNGVREPIWLHPDGSIIDGRNRFVACRKLGIVPPSHIWEGGGSLVSFVLSLNLHRRHLDESQRAIVAAKAKPIFESEAKERQGARTDIVANLPPSDFGKSRDKAAEMLSVSPRSVESASKVLREGAPDLVAAVEQGRVAVSTAATISTAPKEQQREIVAKGEKEILAAAKEIRDQRKLQGLSTLNMSESNEWYTPADYVDAAREVMGEIDLDPASCEQANQTVRAKTFYSQIDDGMSKSWSGRVWMNPPYGRADDNESNQSRWSTKLREEYEAGRVTEAVMLVNAVTDRTWFQPLWGHSICFVFGRIKFYAPDGRPPSPTHGSVLVYFGDNKDRFVDVFKKFGRVVLSGYEFSEVAS